MSELLLGGLLLQFFAPFLVTCIFTLIGFFVGRAYGRRQGYKAGWSACCKSGHVVPNISVMSRGDFDD